MRQSLALEAKLAREHQQIDAETRVVAERTREGAVRRHCAEVRLAMERLIWDEYEQDNVEDLLDGLHQRLDLEILTDSFLTTPVEAHIERLSADLGLDAPPDDDDAEEPAGDNPPTAPRCVPPGAERPDLADDYWRSSA